MKNIDRTIAQIVLVENAGEGDSDGEEFLEDLYKDIQRENKEIKKRKSRRTRN